MATATAAFGCDLFAKLRDKAGNLFFSPLSIETALAMTSAGARGETLAEMDKVLHLPAGRATRRRRLLRACRPAPDAKYELAIANALWGQQGLPFRQEFLAETQQQYSARRYTPSTSASPSRPGRRSTTGSSSRPRTGSRTCSAPAR